MKPIILVTPARDPVTHLVGIRRQYLDAVLRAGGLPLLMPLTVVPSEIEAYLTRADGLLLTGGNDCDPRMFGEAPHPKLGRVDHDRDALESYVARWAWRTQCPTLAICRGMQLLNVALGGTLWQDLPSQCGTDPNRHNQPEDYVVTKHAVTITLGSRLSRVVGTEPLAVNSRHHQAVRELAPGFIVGAMSPTDQVIESIEAPEHRWMLAVQWHPEMLTHLSTRHLALFEALVRESSL